MGPSPDDGGAPILRDRAPVPIEITAGEYGYEPAYFRRLLTAGAVDVLQADATRCLVSGFLAAGALAEAFSVPLSAHTAPAVHVHPGCSVQNVRHVEWFHDHVRIEKLLFDGAVEPDRRYLQPVLDRPGLGPELRRADAARYLVYPAKPAKPPTIAP